MPALFRWLADRALADSIAGDLEQQRRLRARHSPMRAALWHWRRTAAIALYFAAMRMQTLVERAFRREVAQTGGFGGDLNYAIRTLRRSPAYAATVIGVIALAMALATTVFAVVDGVLFKPLPYPNGDRLVSIESGFNNLPAATVAPPSWVKPRTTAGASLQDIAGWQAAAPEASITAVRAFNQLRMGGGVNEAPSGVAEVQRNFFDTIGVQPLAGGLTAADFDHQDIVRPVVISYDVWQTKFRGRSDVIGQKSISDPARGSGFRVAGVMPRGFVFPSGDADVSFIAPYIPSPSDLLYPTRRNFFEVFARLPRGMANVELRGRVEAGMAAVAATRPTEPRRPGSSDRSWRMQGPVDQATIVPLASTLASAERPLFRAIFLAALVLVALGGLNISGLMAARGLDRARELGLRRMLGATRFRLGRLVFLEALVPIIAGTAIGLFLAVSLLRLGVGLLPRIWCCSRHTSSPRSTYAS